MGCSNTKSELIYNIPDPDSNDVPGETKAHVNRLFPHVRKYQEQIEASTILEEIIKTAKRLSDKPSLGARKAISATETEKTYSFLSYGETLKYAENFAQNSKALNLAELQEFEGQPGKWKILGIFARNCTEWIINDLACQLDDITTVTFYSTLGAESFDHIFRQTKISTVAVSPESIKKLVEFHQKFKFDTLKNVIIYNLTLFHNNADHKILEDLGIKVHLFTDLIKDPLTKQELTKPKPNSVLTICYTSGTTSLPKGAMLAQKGFYSQISLLIDTGITYTENDTQICYLPLAHVMERSNVLVSLASGSKVGFLSGTDVKKYLMEDLTILKPTILIAVPRILINFHQKVLDTFAKLKGCAKSLADAGLKSKRENYQNAHSIHNLYYDNLVFKNVRAKFGGNLRAVITGSAPVPRDISTDIKLLLSVPLVEGYGMTELSGGSNGTSVEDFTNSNVGGVIRSLFLKLVDRKEMNYHSQTQLEGKLAPTGEICYKGPSVFLGYFKDLENTKQTIDEDGWLHTGDVGMIDPVNKGLKIVDRVKEIFKLSQGEYIAPAKLEGAYNKSPFVGQICIYGNSEKSNIIAIIVINKEKCSQILKENSIIGADEKLSEKHLEEPKLIEAISKNFDEIAKVNKFNSLERPLKFILTLEEFSVNNELMTPTMKLVRKKIQTHFQDKINKAYQ